MERATSPPTFDGATNSSRWTLRDLSGKVLRDFTFDWVGDPATQRWRLSRDYIYRDGLLLAAVTPSGTLHFSLDHLGTPRVVTDDNKIRVGLHYYLPFGEEWTITPQASDSEPMKFTGHERDTDMAGGTAALDYMHARYYNPGLGRFSSMDPTWESAFLRNTAELEPLLIRDEQPDEVHRPDWARLQMRNDHEGRRQQRTDLQRGNRCRG